MTRPSNPETVRAVALAPAALDALERAALAAAPWEACGLLLGARRGDTWRLSAAVASRNLLAPRTRGAFELDPGALVRAEDAARAAGLELAAVWHSHVDAAAAPSAADRAGVWSGWLQVIVALRGDAVHDVRAFDLSGERPRELALAPLPCNRPFGALP